MVWSCDKIKFHAQNNSSGSIEGERRRGRPKIQRQDNIMKWTGIDINKAMRAAENIEGWKKIVMKSTAPLWHPNAMG